MSLISLSVSYDKSGVWIGRSVRLTASFRKIRPKEREDWTKGSEQKTKGSQQKDKIQDNSM